MPGGPKRGMTDWPHSVSLDSASLDVLLDPALLDSASSDSVLLDSVLLQLTCCSVGGSGSESSNSRG